MADFNRLLSGYDIVKAVLQQIGLPVPNTIAGATDTLSVQMWGLINELGQDLIGKFQWQMRTRVLTINTIPGTLEYDLPSDFNRIIDDTEWNNTARLPALGPMSAQAWALLKARQLGGTTLSLQYTLRANKIVFYYVPTTPNEIAFTYESRGWVTDATDPAKFKDQLQADGDICQFDPHLMKIGLRYRWRESKGFDVTAIKKQYDEAYAQATNADTPGKSLKMSRMGQGFPYLGLWNLPDTGIGG